MTNQRNLVILFGSETGNSADLAHVLARKCRYQQFNVTVTPMNRFEVKNLLETSILVVICSTMGQGDIPRNATKFWKFMLQKKLPSNLLNHVRFTTFGLGDSSYPKYNHAIRKIHNRFLQLGAIEMSPRGESDEQSPLGSEVFYIEWEKVFFENLGKICVLFDDVNSDTLLPPENTFVVLGEKAATEDSKLVALNRAGDTTRKGTIVFNKRITAETHYQDVRQLVIEDDSGSLAYSPGDTVALYPTNDSEDVDQLLRYLKWDHIADNLIQLNGELGVDGEVVMPLTLRSLFTHHLDINAIPRRSFFQILYHFSDNERHREKLKEFSLVEESESLYDYANRPRRSIMEVIQEFESLHIPLEHCLDLFPLIHPRLFSISSGPDSRRVELTIAIVEYKTIIRKVRKGLCTRWIKTLQKGDQIVFEVHRNNLKLDSQTPIIMVGPGTGIAPMKSLIEYELGKDIPRDMYLFTGHRYRSQDFLYGSQWENRKLQLFTSFSRESGGYVQERLYEHKELVNDLLINQKAYFYLCGSSGKMPIQIRITIETILQECNDWSEDKAKQYLQQIESEHRYFQETW
ncbi:unnamed protein product [Kuraishia capsulata CBS 1993]|uniref:NADPH-dependent diflavin oxidoreductase 1 n=1 Tax=Kuraishia capsulata CBS 1993 TaxID=1382522 RepID=W6MFW3_9ASCO|nr:uncharacterized protein KUCA_T00000806001 [Kuraishia capsulata CBS 1993]CDK24839.1 unnamed protein product [Kuraishia capsulata CBS 1993]